MSLNADLNKIQETDLYQQIVEHLPVAVILTNEEGLITGANPFVVNLLGFSEQELTTLPFNQLISFHVKDGVAHTKTAFSSFTDIQQIADAHTEFMVRKKEGAPFFAEIQSSTYNDGLKNILIWTIRPIHREQTLIYELKERVKVQLALLSVTETLFKCADLSSALKECIPYIREGWQFPEYTVVRITLKDGAGYTSEGFEETPWGIFSTIESNQQHYGTIEVFYTTEVPAYGDSIFLAEEKKLLDGLAKLFSIFLDQLYTINKLRENEKLITKITGQIPANTYQFEIFEDGNVNVFFGSKGLNELMYDYTSDEMVNNITKVIDVIQEEDKKLFYQTMKEAYHNHADINMQYRTLHNDTVRWRWFRATSEKLENGKFIWYGSSQDVTPFIDYIDVLEQILSDISHVIRRPIATMLGLTDYIENATLTEENLKEIAQTIKTVVKEMDDYTQKLNEVYREKILNTSAGKMGFPHLIKRQRYFKS